MSFGNDSSQFGIFDIIRLPKLDLIPFRVYQVDKAAVAGFFNRISW
jgi:hypothetical protein